ncbi:voltage-gated potassium channel [Bacillus fengqiuensis]|nr:voltage-gated potassium channel [Bacillus fengqiuensis]
MHIFFQIWRKFIKLKFVTILLLSAAIISFGTFSIHLLEPETFPTLFEGLWWTMTTLTTVGYGDYSPKTTGGRLVGMFLFLFGIGIIGLLISRFVDLISTYNRLKTEGKLMYKRKNHYIYITYSKKTKDAIEEVLAAEPLAEIVLIDTFPSVPYEHDQLFYVQGDPSEEATLLKANILHAKRVCIFSDSSIDDSTLADGKTLLIATAVESLSHTYEQNIHTIVEISKESHIGKFKHVNVDDFILSNDSVSRLMARATLHPGTTNIFRQLLSKKYGSNIHEIKPMPEWKTIRDAYLSLFEQGAVLISINEDMNFLADKEHPLQPDDMLFIVCNDEALSKFS